jgi:hypothetical protein
MGTPSHTGLDGSRYRAAVLKEGASRKGRPFSVIDSESSMTDRLDSTIVRTLVELGASGDPLMVLLVTYLGDAFRASLFGVVRASMMPHQEKIREVLNSPPSDANLRTVDLPIIQEISRELELVYRIAVFDSFLNNLTSYALARRPSKAIGRAQMQVSILLGKTRAEVVNDYIARRTKSLSRETFGARIQALREITETDFQIPKDHLDELKRISNLRNTIIHEGSAYQFSIDNDLHIHSHAAMQTVTMGMESLEVITKIAALIYEQYVTKFIGRELHDLERRSLTALSRSTRATQ